MVKTNIDVNGNELPCTLYLDGYLKRNLDDLEKYVKLDWDGIGLYIGDEGDGKSVKAMQDALYLDHTFNLDKIVFTPEQFEKMVDTITKGSCIVWDEADALTSHWASEMLTSLKRKFKTMRDKNLKVLLVTPTIFDMNKYFIMSRTRYMLHIYANDFERGFFRFFNKDRKKKLYIHGKKDWNMGIVPPNFKGRFTNLPEGFPLDFNKYKDKKHESTKKILGEKKTPAEIERGLLEFISPRLKRLMAARSGYKVTQLDIGYIFNRSKASIAAITPKKKPKLKKLSDLGIKNANEGISSKELKVLPA